MKHSMAQILRRWWRRLWADDLTAYLSQAVDRVDLECHLRRWNDVDRRGRPPLL